MGTGLVGVTVTQGGTVALRRVTLLAEPGELLVVLGPSGSGKSTLLRAVAGLVPVRSGAILIDGADATDWPAQRRDVAMVFEYTALLPFLDVSDNLGFGLRLRHGANEEVDDRVRAQARGLGLTRMLARRPTTLSVGEQAQVGIGRALIRVPTVFLLDEPLGHHDAAGRAAMRRHIAVVVKTLGVTTLYVTHDQGEAMAMADRIAVLRDGSVLQVAAPRELYTRPAGIFVARFVGADPIGLLAATVLEQSGRLAFRIGSHLLTSDRRVPAGLRERLGRAVVLGVRSEDVGDARVPGPEHAGTLPGVVSHVEYTGAHTTVTVAVPGEPVPVPDPEGPDRGAGTAELRARLAARTAVRTGDAVPLRVDLSRAHVFDPGTGAALAHLDEP